MRADRQRDRQTYTLGTILGIASPPGAARIRYSLCPTCSALLITLAYITLHKTFIVRIGIIISRCTKHNQYNKINKKYESQTWQNPLASMARDDSPASSTGAASSTASRMAPGSSTAAEMRGEVGSEFET